MAVTIIVGCVCQREYSLRKEQQSFDDDNEEKMRFTEMLDGLVLS